MRCMHIVRYGQRCLAAVGILCSAISASIAAAQAPMNTSLQGMPQQQVQQQMPAYQPAGVQQQVALPQHPLVPALEVAQRVQNWMDANLKDYTAIVIKQERIDGKLGDPQYANIKVRQHPFSVYMGFIAPANLKDQECMYIEGANDGKMWAHAPPDTLRGKFGTVSIAPNSPMAMQGQHYPITEIGISNLTKRLIEVGEHDKQYGECDVKFFQGAKVLGRSCTMIQVMHPTPRRTFLFNVAKICIDDQLQVPIHYESYDWPSQAGGQPELIESYTYKDLTINPGLTDADFNVHNPAYHFGNVK